MLLTDYKPRSELVVERTEVKGPTFPVIDIHARFGPLTLRTNYAEYDTKTEVERLKQLGALYH